MKFGVIACRALLEMVYRDNEIKPWTVGYFLLFKSHKCLQWQISQSVPENLGLLAGVPGMCTSGSEGWGGHIWL